MPDGCLVIFLANGTKKNSYKGRRIDMKARGITGIEAGGTRNEPRNRFMTCPCWTEKVWSWARQVFIRMVLAIIGSILVRTFTSSTWVTVQRVHGVAWVGSLQGTAALSSQLQSLTDWKC